jgi:hypothetical protein
MASVVISGDTSGSITLSAPTVAGSSTQTLVAATGTLAPLVSGTAVASTSGTLIDFTGLPSWVKRVTLMFSGVSTSSTAFKLIQLIHSGGTVTATGYNSTSVRMNTTSMAQSNETTGFFINNNLAADALDGFYQFTNLNGNTWVGSGSMSAASTGYSMAGGVTLAGVLSGIRITTQGGTNTFDAGSINIMYE